MTINNAKTILFASLIVAMILPFSTMDFADAKQDNNQRMETKKQNIENLGEETSNLYGKIFDLEAQLEDLESETSTDETVKKQQKIEKKIADAYGKLNKLQERAYKLFEIPEKRYQKLLEAKQDIINQYQDTGMLDDIFIDHSDESIQVILHSDYFDSHKDSVKSNADSIAASKRLATLASVDGDIGNIKVGIKHFTKSSAVASDVVCAELDSTRSDRHTKCARVTISFPATRGSVDGFVTVGHAFDDVLSASAGIPSTQLDVFQPGPDYTQPSRGGVGVIPSNAPADRDTFSDTYWQNQIIGHITYGIYQGSTVHDSAFVDLDSGETVNAKVNLWRDREYSIRSYESTASQSVGNYVYQSGATTGVTGGYIISKGNIGGIYAAYHECDGDSGAPVGRYSSGFKVFGIHAGQADDNTYFNQADCSDADKYSRYIPYDVIASDLGIVGSTR